jgi:mevalonate kinase
VEKEEVERKKKEEKKKKKKFQMAPSSVDVLAFVYRQIVWLVAGKRHGMWVHR